jgi:hypothetical protein
VEQEEQVKETEEEKVEKAALFLLESPANQMYVTGGRIRIVRMCRRRIIGAWSRGVFDGEGVGREG